jgi:hypothetical protein
MQKRSGFDPHANFGRENPLSKKLEMKLDLQA